MIESYDIESFEQVVEKKRVRGFEPKTPFALCSLQKHGIVRYLLSKNLGSLRKKKFLNKMVNTKNENVLDVWRKRK